MVVGEQQPVPGDERRRAAVDVDDGSQQAATRRRIPEGAGRHLEPLLGQPSLVELSELLGRPLAFEARTPAATSAADTMARGVLTRMALV